MNRWLSLAVAASLGLTACAKKAEVAAPVAPAQSAAPAAAAPATAAATPNSGKVVQSQQGAGYTYAEVETADGKKVWIAGGHIDVKPGDVVQWGDYSVMTNFNAKSLGRVFDQILFVNTWGPLGAAVTNMAPHGAQPGQHPPIPQAASPVASAPGAAAAPAASAGEVRSAANAGGYTYLEVAQNGATVWIAAPETQVKAGDKVSWDGGMVMHNFTSSSLNRKFDEIVFAGAVRVTP
jgi:hypothetical protein